MRLMKEFQASDKPPHPENFFIPRIKALASLLSKHVYFFLLFNIFYGASITASATPAVYVRGKST